MANSPGFVLNPFKKSVLDCLIHRLQRKNFLARREKELLHILAPDAETASGNASDYLIFPGARWLAFQAERIEVL